MVMYATFSSLLNLYIYCYFGTFTTSNFEKLETYIYESEWYNLPNDLQKYFIMMIKNAQQQLTYDGFRFVSLNLITLAKVCLTGFSIQMGNQLTNFWFIFGLGSENSFIVLFDVESNFPEITCVLSGFKNDLFVDWFFLEFEFSTISPIEVC